jgi:hypothetical protein
MNPSSAVAGIGRAPRSVANLLIPEQEIDAMSVGGFAFSQTLQMSANFTGTAQYGRARSR